MSLSALNSPPLVGALTIGCYGLFPIFKNAFVNPSIPWIVVKSGNLLAYGISLYSVSQPGRYDGEASKEFDKSGKTSPASEGMKRMGTGKHGRTLVPPAGWAFIIWAPIFIGELIMVSSQVTLAEDSSVAPLIREISGPYIFAQCFQTLWTASFRPKYDQGLYKFISALNLAGIAFSLSFSHKAYTETNIKYSNGMYWLYFLPITLHFGWTTAAALVNVNGMYALSDQVTSKSVALLGYTSIVVASATGMAVTINRNAPVYAGVICWALSAVASGLGKRIKDTEKEDPSRVGVYGAKFQQYLSLVGATACAATAIATILKK